MSSKTKSFKKHDLITRKRMGRRLDEIRKGRFPTISDLARQAEVEFSVVWRFINGQSNPSLDTLQKIARAFGMEVDIFLSTITKP